MENILLYDINGMKIDSLTQWDHDVSIEIVGAKTYPIPIAYYSNRKIFNAIRVDTQIKNDRVLSKIPNELLCECIPIKIRLFYYYESGDSKTEYQAVIPVSPAKKPDGYAYTPSEVKSWIKLEKRIEELEQAEGSTVSADRFEAANYWAMSSTDALGNAVYLYPGNTGYAGYPNRAAEYSRLNLVEGSEENTCSIVANDADVSNMDSCYLYFDRAALRWDRVSSPGNNATWKTNTSLRLYREAMDGEESSTEIPGYVRVTSLGYVTEGRYLIAAPGNDGGIYLLYPSTARNNRYQQTAKVIDGSTVGIGNNSSFSAGMVSLTDCLYTFAKYAESWESGVNLTITQPSDDGENTQTTIRVLDGEDGGHYTPAVTQPTNGTIQIVFTPSNASMPVVAPVTVQLPSGSSGSGANASYNAETGELIIDDASYDEATGELNI